jgi:serine/threonine protein kinase
MMDLYDWSLKDFIKSEERLEYIIFKVICYQMARAIFYVHSKGVTHRDVKPENFLMKKSGRVVLSDFGSAKMIKKGEESLSYLNSRSYRAPELLLGNKAYSNSVDIWALACVMIELITRKEIFKGSSTIDCLLNICRIFGSKDLRRLK